MTEAQRGLELLSGIAAIHRASFGEVNLEEIAGIAVREVDKHLPCERSAVFLFDEKDNCILATVGLEDVTGIFGSRMPVMDYLNRTGRPVFSGDARSGPLLEYVLPGQEVNSVALAPVRIKGNILGLLYADASGRNIFDDDDLVILDVLSEEISRTLLIERMRSVIRELTVEDDLTGCLNRRRFEEDLDLEIACAERYDRVLSVVIANIDGFQRYKDLHGDKYADSLLREVAEVLTLSIRVCDKLYRFSEKDFALILPGIDRERAFFTAKRLQAVIGKKLFGAREDDGMPGKAITVSAGIASFPADSVYRVGLIKHAGSSLVRAKGKGNNSVA